MKTKNSLMGILVFAGVICFSAVVMPLLASTPKLAYRSYMYRKASSACDTSTILIATPQLAFQGMTLSDVAKRVENGYVFGAYQSGAQCARTHMQAKDVLICRNPKTDKIVKIVAVFVLDDDKNTKSISVELTDGADGVYAKAAGTQYISGKNVDFPFVEEDGNGDVIYSCDSSNAEKASPTTLATTWGGKSYGLCSLSLVKAVPNRPTLFFANAPGEPVLTVEDIKDYDITADFCGCVVAADVVGKAMTPCNRKVKTDAAGIATSIRIEFQYKEGDHLKCAIVEFTNGEGGVYAQQTHSLYYTGGNVGYKFINDDDSLNTITGSNAPGFYGHCGLRTDSAGYSAMTVCAAPPEASLTKMLWNEAENMFAKTHNIKDVSTLPILTKEWVKILDGISLQEMVDDEYEISAYLCGSAISVKQKVYAKGLQCYKSSDDAPISKALCWFVIIDDKHTKSVTIEMESREDGVYARYSKGQFLRSKQNLDFKFSWFDEKGNVVYAYAQQNAVAEENANKPTTWTASGYGIAGLKASRYMKKDESRLVFANPVGEKVLTLDDIKDYYFGCNFSGNNVSEKDREAIGLHKMFEYEGESVKSMRVEFQTYDGGWNKCVIVNFTNGVDGVYGYAEAAGHAGENSGTIGFHFVNEKGEFVNATDGVVTAYHGLHGYGIYDLFAVPMVTLNRDTDWNGGDSVIELGDMVVDLNGHNLTLQGISFNSPLKYSSLRVFNSNKEVMSELHLNIPGGVIFNNNKVCFGRSDALYDNIKFVKEGNGTYVASIGQAYKGGTEVVSGTIKPTGNGTADQFGPRPDVKIEIGPDGAFDINGQLDYNSYQFVLNGGKIINTGSDNTDNQGIIRKISLMTDSSFVLPKSSGIIGYSYADTSLDLAGHKLSVYIGSEKAFFLVNSTITGGIVELWNDSENGGLQTGRKDRADANKMINAKEVDFKVGCALSLYAPLSVRNYEALYGYNSNAGNAALDVYGTFTPSVHDYFRGCTMMDGSTIDLSLRETVLPLVSAFTNESSDRTLKFADGATVYVALGEKKLSDDGKVISWDEKPANIRTVKFVGAPGDSKGVYIAKDDGLYRSTGLMIMVR